MKVPDFFEIRWTSDTPKGHIALSNHAYSLCRTLPAAHCLQGHLNCTAGN